MDPCYLSGKNCLPHHDCPGSYECCTQTVDHTGKKIENPTFGLCVQSGTCNSSTGLCSSRGTGRTVTERFAIGTREGFDGCACTKWKNAFWMLIVIVLVLMFLILSKTKVY